MQVTTKLVELQEAVSKYLESQMKHYNDSRTVPDELVELAKSLMESKHGTFSD